MISLSTKPPTPDHIEDLVKIPLISEWYDPIFQTIIKWKHPQNSVNHFYFTCYHQTQRCSDPEYILGSKQLALTTNMIYTQEHVKMCHP